MARGRHEDDPNKLTADHVVGAGVRALRERRGISQQELGDALGWPQSTVARLELGKRPVSVSDLLALAWALDVAPVYLLDGSFQTSDVPVQQTLRIPTPHARKWIRGGEPLPGLNYRAYFENIPDDEWSARYGSLEDQRAAAAFRYEQADIPLEAGERGPGPELSPEDEERLAEERRLRQEQLRASKKAGGNG